MDESIVDVDRIDNLVKFCPTKDEMELLKVASFLLSAILKVNVAVIIHLLLTRVLVFLLVI